jgi:uncharacterized protein YbbC (DUF1343 family)
VHPGDSKYADTLVQGIRLTVTDRETYDPTQTAVAMLFAIENNSGPRGCIHCSIEDRERFDRSHFLFAWTPAQFNRLAGARRFFTMVQAGIPSDPQWPPALEQFRARRKPFLLYPE